MFALAEPEQPERGPAWECQCGHFTVYDSIYHGFFPPLEFRLPTTQILTAASSSVAIQSVLPAMTPCVDLMAKLMETAASSAAHTRKCGAHQTDVKPEELEHTLSGGSWYGSPTAAISPVVNPPLLHVPLLVLTPLSPPRHCRS